MQETAPYCLSCFGFFFLIVCNIEQNTSKLIVELLVFFFHPLACAEICTQAHVGAECRPQIRNVRVNPSHNGVMKRTKHKAFCVPRGF